jgi:1-acyl-sn-glycerol-3-phosphate acyltransferase
MKPPTVVDRALRWLFFWLVVRPIVLVGLGLNVRHRERLPAGGPAVLVANHNSHLDTMVLMTLLPSRLLPLVHPVAAADYFLRNPLLAWFALRIIGIIPIQRRPAAVPSGSPRPDPLAEVAAALERGAIVILFPEGSRGEPERLSEFKTGVARLCERFPQVPFIPLFLHGLGKALPRGSILPVPFFCDIFVGHPVPWCDDHHVYVDHLRSSLESLSTEDHLAAWE